MIHADGLTLYAGAFRLGPLSLHVAAGEYFVLLGPPGAGKSLFLEVLCGLRPLASGKVFLHGRDVTRLEPRRRPAGYVPQDYALFPHLTVEQNIAFGLRANGATRPEIRRKVAEVADMLGIRALLPRHTAGLSGGERQRTALARALVLEPRALLLDEPVSALDEAGRQTVCLELRRLQERLGITVIHVSHNLEEALSVADRAGVLHQGTFQQVGPLHELLRRPANTFTARFLCAGNILAGTTEGEGPEPGTTRVRLGEILLVVPGTHRGPLEVMIRPEDVDLRPLPEKDTAVPRAANALPARVKGRFDAGRYVRIELEAPFPLLVHASHAAAERAGAKPENRVLAVLPEDRLHVLCEP